MSALQRSPSSSTYQATYQTARQHCHDQGVLIERLRACVALIAEQDPLHDRRAVWSRQVARLAEHVADDAARAELLRSLWDLVLPCTADERYAALAQIGDWLPDAGRQAALEALLVEARAEADPYDRALALITVIHVLDAGEACNAVFGDVLAAIRQVPPHDFPMVCIGEAKNIIYRLKRGTRTDARRELERAARAIPNRQARREALAQLGR